MTDAVPHPETAAEPQGPSGPEPAAGPARDAEAGEGPLRAPEGLQGPAESPAEDPAEDLSGDLGDGPEGDVEPRRYPSTMGGAFYLAILVTATVAVAGVTAADWRLGVRLLAGCLGAAGLLRLVLPQKDAGMLAVRRRPVDVVLLVGVGAALYWLAGSIPDQPA